MKAVTNWGLYPVVQADWLETDREDKIRLFLGRNGESLIARGLGRCYGDASLFGKIFSTRALKRILNFDRDAGVLTCEAGVSFAQILDKIVTAGWFLPVTPGTRFITVGGAIASDIHGKNHHIEGSFCNHLLSFLLLGPDGKTYICSRDQNPELFRMTCGGMGLTGIILQASFRLKKIESAYINQHIVKASHLEEVMRLFEQHRSSTYSVAWIDGLSKGRSMGRSLLMLGEHADVRSAPSPPYLRPPSRSRSIPFFLPGFVLNTWSMKIFNALYYARAGRNVKHQSHYEPYFYPLDGVLHWNRIYGKRGFTQYQLVLPMSESEKGLTEILENMRREGFGSFLSVLKLFGPQGEGPLSFPMEGYTLTLDFPITPRLFPFLNKLDRVVLKYGGRLYLSKDVRMSAETFGQSYPGAEAFKQWLRAWDPGEKFASLQSHRLGITGQARNGETADGKDTILANRKTMQQKSALIIGASSGLGKALALHYARMGWGVILAARNQEALEKVEEQIRASGHQHVRVMPLDVAQRDTHSAFVEALEAIPDTVICASGYLGNHDLALWDGEEARRIHITNFEGPASLLSLFANAMEKRGRGTLIGVSSVAGDRGRQSNYYYGSAKAGFTAYLSGLRNRLQGHGVHVMTVIPGYMRTAMTEGMKLPSALTASPEQAARDIYRGHSRRQNVVYTLGIWRWIMCIIRNIPEGIFKKLKL